MKQKISISVEQKTLEKLDEILEDGQFRNKSHLIEFSLNKFLKEQKNE